MTRFQKLFLMFVVLFVAMVFSMPHTFASYVPDTSLISDATDAITAIVAAAILVFVAAFGWPVGLKVYGVAKRVLRAA
jgi:hypothetical protein